ncbi:MAG: CPBP family intramembrane metalloprotease [Desulfobacterales bacterium]|nr:CPBP family intramembrane metalloprotease [Desulfobacterales bacterium]
MLITFIPIALVITVFTFIFLKNRFLVFPISGPGSCLNFILIYPILSALPQEIIYKSFFFKRYSSVFSIDTLIFLNGLSFGLAHLWYANMIAPIISMLGGIMLAYRYLHTKSLIIVSIEHSLWGIFLYFVGLGWYFYSGCIQ